MLWTDRVSLSARGRMHAATCGCPAAHTALACSNPARCMGPVHHVARCMAGVPQDKIDLVLGSIAAQEEVAVATVRERYERGRAGARCAPGCQCVCHTCTPRCFDEALRLRDHQTAGPVAFLFLLSHRLCADGQLHCLCKGAEGEGGPPRVRSVQALVEESRAATVSNAIASLPAHVASDVDEPPADAALRGTQVSFRVEADEYLYDTLLVDTRSDWCALMVETSEGPVLFSLPSLAREEDVAFESYRGYVTFDMLYGRRGHSTASEDERKCVLDATEALWAEAKSHRVARLQECAARRRRQSDVDVDVETMIRTPRLVTLGLSPRRQVSAPPDPSWCYVRLLYHHGESRERTDEGDYAQIGRRFWATKRPAEAMAQEGNPDAVLGMFDDIYRFGEALHHGCGKTRARS